MLRYIYESKVTGELYAAPFFVASHPAQLDRKKSAGNKAGNVRITEHCGTFEQLLLVEKQRVLHILCVRL
jgi:hypothetical protein